jgi:hypothetical protein
MNVSMVPVQQCIIRPDDRGGVKPGGGAMLGHHQRSDLTAAQRKQIAAALRVIGEELKGERR